ncbi:MAG: hypothetical protein H6772_04555 [Pseudomonadales bacterium]|nr:hypothetical protein [Pseudomonadales bacterium]
MTFRNNIIQNFHSETILTDVVNSINLCKLLRNENVIEFVKYVITEHYHCIFSSNKYSSILIDQTFKILQESQQKNLSIINLKNSINFISKNIYSKNKAEEFYKEYDLYKSFLKPNYYYSIIKNDIIGEKILDFGSGKGYMSKLILDKGFKIISSDVLDYREIKQSSIPFIKINSSSDISKRIIKNDTSILITVLHHISKSNLINTITELSKISKRLIIIEDVFDSKYIKKNNLNKNKKITEQFLNLSPKSQMESVMLMDFYGNIVTQGLTKMNLPFQFKSVSEWKFLLNKCGFKNIKIEYIGLPKISFHGFFQIKIVCDSKNY